MDVYNQSEYNFPKIQIQNLLTLQRRSFAEWAVDILVVYVVYKQCQYIGYA
jgi:hypothetical protein